ncbi:MAG: Trk family potassium uptake protein [Clostridia bacterium]|nr:Trk family potassium uptake protein [Clostridia bacterium]
MGEKVRKKLSSFQIIMLGFAGVILLGALLLMLPISSKNRQFTPFLDSLFTSTSAVCVTGLIVYDTATHWSIFGQSIILLLIQIGGLGVITIATSLALLSGKKLGLFGKETMQSSISAPNLGNIAELTGFILKGVFIIELLGAIIMMPTFIIDFGAKGIWMAFFHSISAFCNAGFDLMGGVSGQFSSLTYYKTNPIINLTIISLILIGGIGFLTWEDVVKHKWHFSKYRFQTKAVLIISAVLIIFPTIYFFFAEFNGLPFGERLLLSLFQTVTPRTAGFNTANFARISQTGILVMICLMLVGGSSGSTAGGMKITTITVLFASTVSVFKRKNNAEILKRRIDDDTVKSAMAIFVLYLSLFIVGSAIICSIENLPILTCMFEVASAIATVGLSLGITPTLGIISKLVLILLMFIGRIGVLTMVFATLSSSKRASKLPLDKISVG